jgi:hypothetical protein
MTERRLFQGRPGRRIVFLALELAGQGSSTVRRSNHANGTLRVDPLWHLTVLRNYFRLGCRNRMALGPAGGCKAAETHL